MSQKDLVDGYRVAFASQPAMGNGEIAMAREYNFFVYILTNYERTVLYIGVTNNLERRLAEHRRRDRPGFTERYRVDRLVYYEQSPEILAALDREKQLKGWSRAKKNALVMSMNPRWEELSASWPGR